MSDFGTERVTLRNPGREVLRQFVIHAENKVGWLNDVVAALNAEDVHVMAISVLDTTDSAVIRMITNYPDETRVILTSLKLSFTERKVIAVEIPREGSLKQVTNALLHAEINIHYVYAFLVQPNQKPALALALEDEDVALDVLASHQVRILSQDDLAR